MVRDIEFHHVLLIHDNNRADVTAVVVGHRAPVVMVTLENGEFQVCDITTPSTGCVPHAAYTRLERLHCTGKNVEVHETCMESQKGQFICQRDTNTALNAF